MQAGIYQKNHLTHVSACQFFSARDIDVKVRHSFVTSKSSSHVRYETLQLRRNGGGVGGGYAWRTRACRMLRPLLVGIMIVMVLVKLFSFSILHDT